MNPRDQSNRRRGTIRLRRLLDQPMIHHGISIGYPQSLLPGARTVRTRRKHGEDHNA